MLKNRLKSKQGFSLPVAIAVTTVLIILSASLIAIAAGSIVSTTSSVNTRQAYLNVKSALEYGYAYYSNSSNVSNLSEVEDQYIVMNDTAGGTLRKGATILGKGSEYFDGGSQTNAQVAVSDYCTYMVADYITGSGGPSRLKLTAYSKSSDAFGNRTQLVHMTASYQINVGGSRSRFTLTDINMDTNVLRAVDDADTISLHCKMPADANWTPFFYVWTFNDEAKMYRGQNCYGLEVLFKDTGKYYKKDSNSNTSYDVLEGFNTNQNEGTNLRTPAGIWNVLSDSNSDKNGPTAMFAPRGKGGWFDGSYYIEEDNVNYFNIIITKKGKVLKAAAGSSDHPDASGTRPAWINNNTVRGIQTNEMFHLWYLNAKDKNVYFEVLQPEVMYRLGKDWNGTEQLNDRMLVYVKNQKTTVHFKMKGIGNNQTDANVKPTQNPVINEVRINGVSIFQEDTTYNNYGNVFSANQYNANKLEHNYMTKQKGKDNYFYSDESEGQKKMTYEGCGWWVANIGTSDSFVMNITYYDKDGKAYTDFVRVSANSTGDAWVVADVQSSYSVDHFIVSKLTEKKALEAISEQSQYDKYVTVHFKSSEIGTPVSPHLDYYSQSVSSESRRKLLDSIVNARSYTKENYEDDVIDALYVVITEATALYNDDSLFMTNPAGADADCEAMRTKLAQEILKVERKPKKVNQEIYDDFEALVNQCDELVTRQNSEHCFDTVAFSAFTATDGVYKTAKNNLNTLFERTGTTETYAEMDRVRAAIATLEAAVVDRTELNAKLEDVTIVTNDSRYKGFAKTGLSSVVNIASPGYKGERRISYYKGSDGSIMFEGEPKEILLLESDVIEQVPDANNSDIEYLKMKVTDTQYETLNILEYQTFVDVDGTDTRTLITIKDADGTVVYTRDTFETSAVINVNTTQEDIDKLTEFLELGINAVKASAETHFQPETSNLVKQIRLGKAKLAETKKDCTEATYLALKEAVDAGEDRLKHLTSAEDIIDDTEYIEDMLEAFTVYKPENSDDKLKADGKKRVWLYGLDRNNPIEGYYEIDGETTTYKTFPGEGAFIQGVYVDVYYRSAETGILVGANKIIDIPTQNLSYFDIENNAGDGVKLNLVLKYQTVDSTGEPVGEVTETFSMEGDPISIGGRNPAVLLDHLTKTKGYNQVDTQTGEQMVKWDNSLTVKGASVAEIYVAGDDLSSLQAEVVYNDSTTAVFQPVTEGHYQVIRYIEKDQGKDSEGNIIHSKVQLYAKRGTEELYSSYKNESHFTTSMEAVRVEFSGAKKAQTSKVLRIPLESAVAGKTTTKVFVRRSYQGTNEEGNTVNLTQDIQAARYGDYYYIAEIPNNADGTFQIVRVTDGGATNNLGKTFTQSDIGTNGGVFAVQYTSTTNINDYSFTLVETRRTQALDMVEVRQIHPMYETIGSSSGSGSSSFNTTLVSETLMSNLGMPLLSVSEPTDPEPDTRVAAQFDIFGCSGADNKPTKNMGMTVIWLDEEVYNNFMKTPTGGDAPYISVTAKSGEYLTNGTDGREQMMRVSNSNYFYIVVPSRAYHCVFFAKDNASSKITKATIKGKQYNFGDTDSSGKYQKWETSYGGWYGGGRTLKTYTEDRRGWIYLDHPEHCYKSPPSYLTSDFPDSAEKFCYCTGDAGCIISEQNNGNCLFETITMAVATRDAYLDTLTGITDAQKESMKSTFRVGGGYGQNGQTDRDQDGQAETYYMDAWHLTFGVYLNNSESWSKRDNYVPASEVKHVYETTYDWWGRAQQTEDTTKKYYLYYNRAIPTDTPPTYYYKEVAPDFGTDASDNKNNIRMAFVGGTKIRMENDPYYSTYSKAYSGAVVSVTSDWYNGDHSTKLSGTNRFGGNGGNWNSEHRIGDTQLRTVFDWYERKIPVDSSDVFTFQLKGIRVDSAVMGRSEYAGQNWYDDDYVTDDKYTVVMSGVYGNDIYVEAEDTDTFGTGTNATRYAAMKLSAEDPENVQIPTETTLYFAPPASWGNCTITVTGTGVGGSSGAITMNKNTSDCYDSTKDGLYYYAKIPSNKPYLTFNVTRTNGGSYSVRTTLRGDGYVLFTPDSSLSTGKWSTYTSPSTALEEKLYTISSMYYGNIFAKKYNAKGQVVNPGGDTTQGYYNFPEALRDVFINKAFKDSNGAITTIASVSSARSNGITNSVADDWINAYYGSETNPGMYRRLIQARAYIAERNYPEYVRRADKRTYSEDSVYNLTQAYDAAEAEYLAGLNGSSWSDKLNRIRSKQEALEAALNNMTLSTNGQLAIIYYNRNKSVINGSTFKVSYNYEVNGVSVPREQEFGDSKNSEGYPIVFIQDTNGNAINHITNVRLYMNGIPITGTPKDGTDTALKDEMFIFDGAWILWDYLTDYGNGETQASASWVKNSAFDYRTIQKETFEKKDGITSQHYDMTLEVKTLDEWENLKYYPHDPSKTSEEDLTAEKTEAAKLNYKSMSLYFEHDTTVKYDGKEYTIMAGAYAFEGDGKKVGTGSNPFEWVIDDDTSTTVSHTYKYVPKRIYLTNNKTNEWSHGKYSFSNWSGWHVAEYGGNINAYFYNDSGAVGNAWPGTGMTYLKMNDSHQPVYYIDVPEGATSVIFNDNGRNGSGQTKGVSLLSDTTPVEKTAYYLGYWDDNGRSVGTWNAASFAADNYVSGTWKITASTSTSSTTVQRWRPRLELFSDKARDYFTNPKNYFKYENGKEALLTGATQLDGSGIYDAAAKAKYIKNGDSTLNAFYADAALTKIATGAYNYSKDANLTYSKGAFSGLSTAYTINGNLYFRWDSESPLVVGNTVRMQAKEIAFASIGKIDATMIANRHFYFSNIDTTKSEMRIVFPTDIKVSYVDEMRTLHEFTIREGRYTIYKPANANRTWIADLFDEDYWFSDNCVVDNNFEFDDGPEATSSSDRLGDVEYSDSELGSSASSTTGG